MQVGHFQKGVPFAKSVLFPKHDPARSVGYVKYVLKAKKHCKFDTFGL